MLRLRWSKASRVALTLMFAVSTDRTHAQIEDCVAQLNSCIESAAIPDEARGNFRLLEEAWRMIWLGRESGATYFIEEVGLQPQQALVLVEYALWAYDAFNANESLLKTHFCGLLEDVTTGPELNEVYQDGWDWEQRSNQERYRLATGVFAVLPETETAVLLAHLVELAQEPFAISGSAPLLDLETWSPERVARIKWITCEADE